MFGHIYFTVVFHLSPVVRGPACSFIRFLYCNRDVSDDNLNCARDTRKKTRGGSGDGTTCEARDRVGSSHSREHPWLLLNIRNPALFCEWFGITSSSSRKQLISLLFLVVDALIF